MKFEGMRKPNDYIKAWVKDDQELRGVFRGNPHRFLSHWVPRTDDPKRKKRAYCQGENCEICMTGNKSKWTFRINFIQKDEESKQYYASVYEGDDFAYNRLGTLNEEVPLEQYIVKIFKKEENNWTGDYFEKVTELGLERSQIIDSVPLIDLTRI